MVPALFLYLTLSNDVKDLIARNDLAAAERTVQAAQKEAGNTPEYAAAVSWLARGELFANHLERADAYAIETRKLADQLLHTHKLDSDTWLPTAMGAAIEVHAQVLAARGARSEAITFLNEQIALFHNSSIADRLQKNLNLLSLRGKMAPSLDELDWLGGKPIPLASLHGHAVLLFFWAHWCVDCKAEIPILADMERIYGPRGLVLIAPTRYYGYVAGGEDAPPAVERKYIEAVREKFYSPLGNVSAPLSNSNFVKYGASTTPTLVLIDGTGVVRLYHPGNLTEPELAAHIQALLPK
ncbi:MAG TPA: TlpA disulfide reductase family protein [Bryobacteraceae bacterium]|jgi:thiol-disulfide isomerase/thioredoxin|nr:TlpA disulfide reductase family protein [Bryobacteraceae bacterium]